MKKSVLFGILFCAFSGFIFAQSEAKHYDTHPKFPHHATAEERQMIPFLSQQAHLRDAQTPTAPVTAVAEFQPMGGVMIAYPLGVPVSLVRELSQITQVKVLVDSPSDSVQARSYFVNSQVNMSNLEFWLIQHDSYWVRDYGPWFIIDGHDSVGVIDFVYNRPQRPHDDASMEYVVEHLGVNRYEMPMVHTGGNYMADGGYTQTQTQLEVFRTVLPINIIIRCSIARSHPIADMVEDATCAAGVGNPLRSHVHLITVFEQATLQGVSVRVSKGREVNATPLLKLEVGPHTQFLVVVVGDTNTKRRRNRKTVGDGIGGRISLNNTCV